MKYLMKRATAYLIDCIIAFTIVMLLFQWVVLSHVRGFFGITDLWFHDSWNMWLYVFISISLPIWFYFSYLDCRISKGTIGKRVMKLELTNLNRSKIGFGKAAVRTVLKLLPWELAHIGVIFPSPLYYNPEPSVRTLTVLAIILFIVYVIYISVAKSNQSLYDKLLGTQVISIRE